MTVHNNFNPTIKKFEELKKIILINKEGENKCRDQFVDFAKVLARLHNLDLEYIVTEGTVKLSGKRSDLILCGTTSTDKAKNMFKLPRPDMKFATEPKRAIIYEFKSSKCDIFSKNKKKNCSRYLPSRSLNEAETQLIEYWHCLKDGSLLRNEIGFAEWKVELGGIVMGLKFEDDQDPNFQRQPKSSSDLRKEFYDLLHMNLLTWEQILFLTKEEYKY